MLVLGGASQTYVEMVLGLPWELSYLFTGMVRLVLGGMLSGQHSFAYSPYWWEVNDLTCWMTMLTASATKGGHSCSLHEQSGWFQLTLVEMASCCKPQYVDVWPFGFYGPAELVRKRHQGRKCLSCVEKQQWKLKCLVNLYKISEYP